MIKNSLFAAIPFIFFACGLSTSAQSPANSLLETVAQRNNLGSLSIGDMCPDVEIPHIINHTSSQSKISDFKGKLLILDFWATWCAPCVASFGKLDSLQKKFSSQIQILPVTSERTEEVKLFLEKLKKVKHLLPASATDDQLLRKLFKHNTLPHYVWIDKDSRIVAITEGKDVNEKNIQDLLQGKYLDVPVKNDDIKVLSLKGNRNFIYPGIFQVNQKAEYKRLDDSVIETSSIITNYVEGKSPGWSFDSATISLQNLAILSLYQTALFGNGRELFYTNLMSTEVTDSALFEKITCKRFDSKEPIASPGLETLEWKRRNSYCYELKVPSFLAESKFSIMLADINRYFGAKYGIEGLIEKRLTSYLALEQISAEDKLFSNGGQFMSESDYFSIKIQNGSLGDLVWQLSRHLQNDLYIINEVMHKAPIDIVINCQVSNIPSLNKELEKYNLRLIPKQKLMDIGIIRHKR